MIRYNTIINTKGTNGHYYGIYIGTAGAPSPNGQFNDIANNSVCGSQAEDIIIEGTAPDTDNTVEDNTCDSSSGGTGNHCPWNCNDQVSVYYDFDHDGDCCSDNPADWTCNNTLGVGSCNNPGKFNSSGANNHCYLQCNTTGNDPNDCEGTPSGNPVAPVPELPTLVLFSIGLLMLAGYVVLRKRGKD